MSLDPYTGLDPDAPAATLYKSLQYIYTPPPPPPAPTPLPSAAGTSSSVTFGSGGSAVAGIQYAGSSGSITYSQFIALGGSSLF